MTERPDPAHAAREPLDPERWRQIDALFAAALEHPSQERSRFLDAECEGDPALRQTVAELLLNDQQAGDDYLESPVLPQVAEGENRDAPPPASGR